MFTSSKIKFLSKLITYRKTQTNFIRVWKSTVIWIRMLQMEYIVITQSQIIWKLAMLHQTSMLIIKWYCLSKQGGLQLIKNRIFHGLLPQKLWRSHKVTFKNSGTSQHGWCGRWRLFLWLIATISTRPSTLRGARSESRKVFLR